MLARYLALVAVGIFAALAAWPPAGAYSCFAGGRHITVSVANRGIVLAAVEGTPTRRLAFAQATAVVHHLPAGIVVEKAKVGTTGFRIRVPLAVGVAAPGALWLGLIAFDLRRRNRDGPVPDRLGGHDCRKRGRWVSATLAGELAQRSGWVWALRWAAGAGAVVAAWHCVFALPRATAGLLFTDAQALHVAGVACGICVGTILIAFD